MKRLLQPRSSFHRCWLIPTAVALSLAALGCGGSDDADSPGGITADGGSD